MSAFQCSPFVQYSNFIPSLRSSQSLCLFYHIVKKKAIFLSFEIYYNIDEFYMLKLSNFIYFSCVSAFFLRIYCALFLPFAIYALLRSVSFFGVRLRTSHIIFLNWHYRVFHIILSVPLFRDIIALYLTSVRAQKSCKLVKVYPDLIVSIFL